MLALARRYLSDEADAEDAVQDVCVSLLRRTGSSPFGIGYIRSCVINRCRKELRRRQAQSRTVDLAFADTFRSGTGSPDVPDEHFACRSELPPVRWTPS
ncbi:MAG: sigma-70 family RNA polymerase sigma factor [Gemmatimonadota bacterium]